MSKRVIETHKTTTTAAPVVVLVSLVAFVVLGIAAGASELGPRIGVRNTVYALLAAALLIAVLVDAVHHRLAREHDIEQIAPTAAPPGDELTHGSLLAELHLAARLGAELMGEVPASRTGRDPATLA